ncbi:hypothetical protein TRV_06327, partial [Trichophyton verrucosum HKI 0517]
KKGYPAAAAAAAAESQQAHGMKTYQHYKQP